MQVFRYTSLSSPGAHGYELSMAIFIVVIISESNFLLSHFPATFEEIRVSLVKKHLITFVALGHVARTGL